MTVPRLIINAIIIVLFFASSCFGATKIYTGAELKATLKLHDSMIIPGSDSLRLGDTALIRDNDYHIDYTRSVVRLNISVPSGDTLYIKYTPLPSWFQNRYGAEVATQPSSGIKSPAVSVGTVGAPRPSERAAVDISGAKKFSLLSQTGGGSQFSQTLDLRLNGMLRPGLKISGSLSDRGYDPSYGTLDSRISELDKLYLSVESKEFRADVGNLEIAVASDYGRPQLKQVSGMTARFNTYHASAAAAVARPRGAFRSAKFNGTDRNQGPYRIFSGTEIKPIVSGSERVWLDGEPLEHGADKDYIMDYPGSSITFTARRPIDSRSRVEIDYEPVTDDFERMYYNLGGGAALEDSLIHLAVNFIHEGDDKNRMESGDLGAEDLARLEAIGDSVSQNFRSGVVFDPEGDYIEVTDDSGRVYYYYTGEGNGDYRVSFSAVESGRGDYVYIGDGVYRFIGFGRGDYLPIVTIPMPSSENYVETALGFRPAEQAMVKFMVRQSDRDMNLYSSLDDGDNVGRHYTGEVMYGARVQPGTVQNGFRAGAELIEKNFRARQRRDGADLAQKYLIPAGLEAAGDDYRAFASGMAEIRTGYGVYADAGFLRYENQFQSQYGTLALVKAEREGSASYVAYTRLDARLDASGMARGGFGDVVESKLNVRPFDNASVTTMFRCDRRRNDYSGERRGTTEYNYETRLSWLDHSLNLSVYDEDTLTGSWRSRRQRMRGTINSAFNYRSFHSDIFITAQRYSEGELEEDQLLARVGTTYSSDRRNLSVSASYTISEENRFERGITYLEVDPGQGQYILENGQYIPDAEGNFIRVEEVRSGQAAVKAGEKAIRLVYNPDNFYLRLNANSTEDLLAEQSRDWLWLLPFYSNGDRKYLYRRLDYSGELKSLQYPGYYLFNLSASYNYESRLLSGGNRDRHEGIVQAQLRRGFGPWLFTQEVNYFEYMGDVYYGFSDNVDGYSIGASAIYKAGFGQLSGGLSYRRAEGGGQSKQLITEMGPTLRLFRNGETAVRISAYHQSLSAHGTVSYRLTDNKSGEYGAIWSVRSDYKMANDFRFTLTFTGRHSDDRKPRIVGRGEFIAYF